MQLPMDSRRPNELLPYGHYNHVMDIIFAFSEDGQNCETVALSRVRFFPGIMKDLN